MTGLLKTTAGQYTLLVGIVVVSVIMMYFAFTPRSLFGIPEGFRGYPPMVRLTNFTYEDTPYPISTTNKHYKNFTA